MNINKSNELQVLGYADEPIRSGQIVETVRENKFGLRWLRPCLIATDPEAPIRSYNPIGIAMQDAPHRGNEVVGYIQEEIL